MSISHWKDLGEGLKIKWTLPVIVVTMKFCIFLQFFGVRKRARVRMPGAQKPFLPV